MMESADGQGNLTRRTFLQSMAAMGAGMAAGSVAAKAAGVPRPNILIILTDQEREDIPRRLMRLPHRADLRARLLTWRRQTRDPLL